MENKILYFLENYHFETVFSFGLVFAVWGIYTVIDTHNYNSMKGKYKPKK